MQGIQKKIGDFGWAFVCVPDGAPAPFGYTVGLTETYDHPEFIMIGRFLPEEMHLYIAESVKKLEKEREAFQVEEVPDLIVVRADDGTVEKAFIGCRDVIEKYRVFFLGAAAARYGKNGFQAKQLVLPDKGGKLPWEEGFDKKWGVAQPALY